MNPRLARRLLAFVAVVSVALTAGVFVKEALGRARTRRLEDRPEREQLIAYSHDDGVGSRLMDSLINLHSLDEARTMEHTAVIMQGDGGGQIYLTVPVKYVHCNEEALRGLLGALDALEWNDSATARLSFELAPIGSGVFGGMGGGLVIDGVWLHERLTGAGVMPLAASVLYGRRELSEVLTDFPRGIA